MSRSTPTRCSRILKSTIRKTRSFSELTVPQARAWLAIKRGDAQAAIALLEKVRAHDDASLAPYMRGLAYLQLKDSRNAIASFLDATRLKGLAYNTRQSFRLVLSRAGPRLRHGRQ